MQSSRSGRSAALALLDLNLPNVVARLKSLLDDNNTHTRVNAVFALGEIKDPNLASEFIRKFRDSKSEVGFSSKDAIVKIGSAAVQPLVAALNYRGDYAVRMHAAQALGEIGDSRATHSLSNAIRNEITHWPSQRENMISLYHSNPMWRDQMEGVLHFLADALVHIGEPSILPLRDLLEDKNLLPGLHEMVADIIRKIEKLKRS